MISAGAARAMPAQGTAPSSTAEFRDGLRDERVGRGPVARVEAASENGYALAPQRLRERVQSRRVEIARGDAGALGGQTGAPRLRRCLGQRP